MVKKNVILVDFKGHLYAVIFGDIEIWQIFLESLRLAKLKYVSLNLTLNMTQVLTFTFTSTLILEPDNDLDHVPAESLNRNMIYWLLGFNISGSDLDYYLDIAETAGILFDLKISETNLKFLTWLFTFRSSGQEVIWFKISVSIIVSIWFAKAYHSIYIMFPEYFYVVKKNLHVSMAINAK